MGERTRTHLLSERDVLVAVPRVLRERSSEHVRESRGALMQTIERLRDAENRLVIVYVYTATAAIVAGAFFGVLQGLSRSSAFIAPSWFDYYRMLTMHGVLMAL